MTDRFPGVRFAIFAVLCLAATAYVAAVTGNFGRGDLPFFGDQTTYRAELDDVSGLFVGDPVKVAGVSVGRVDDIEVVQGKAVVAFSVDPGVEILDSWETGARWRNVIGQRFFYLYEVPGGAPLEPGAMLPATQSRPVANISAFFNEITPLLQTLDAGEQNKLVNALNTAVIGREETVQQLVADLGSLSGTLADEEPEIRGVLANGTELIDAYNRRDTELQAFLSDLALAGDTLAARDDELLDATRDIAVLQQEFGALLEANADEITGIVDHLDVTTQIIGDNREAFAETVSNLQDGLGTYMLISRFGQWFNVRAVAVQAAMGNQVILCSTEGGQACFAPNSDGTGTEMQTGPTPDPERGANTASAPSQAGAEPAASTARQPGVATVLGGALAGASGGAGS